MARLWGHDNIPIKLTIVTPTSLVLPPEAKLGTTIVVDGKEQVVEMLRRAPEPEYLIIEGAMGRRIALYNLTTKAWVDKVPTVK